MEIIKLKIFGNVPSKSNGYKIITLTPRGKKPRSSLAKTKLLTDYERLFLAQLTGAHKANVEGKLCSSIRVYYDSWRPDLDGCFKVILDLLQKGGVYKNDRQVHKIIAEKFKDAKSPRVEIELTPYLPPDEQLLFEPSEDEVRHWIYAHAPDHIRRALESKCGWGQ